MPPHRSPLHYHSATLFDRNALRFLTGVYNDELTLLSLFILLIVAQSSEPVAHIN